MFVYICVFGNSGYCRIPRQDFGLMQMGLCLDLELSNGNYFKIIIAEAGPNEKK